MLWQVEGFPSFNLWIITSLSIHLSMDTWVISMSWLLLIMLQWTCGWRYLFKIQISFPFDIYLVMKLLNYIVVLILIFWGNSTLFSIVAAPTYISPIAHMGHNVCIVTSSEIWVQQILLGILQRGLWKELKIRKMDNWVLSWFFLNWVGDLRQVPLLPLASVISSGKGGK